MLLVARLSSDFKSAADVPCFVCGLQVPSHVAVWREGCVVGRVCGSHPVAELVLAVLPDGERLDITIELRPDD
jgi:hypothetical protein